MFKIHFPVNYSKPKLLVFGSDDFHKAYFKPLLKSFGLTFVGDGGQVPHGWAPTDAGISQDPEEPDHPPWNHHPETGELLPGGKHTIDFVREDLMRRFGLDEQQSEYVLQKAIDRYNQKHQDEYGDDSQHTLPNFDSNQWRKVHVGPWYEHDMETHMRKARRGEPQQPGGPRPLITYAYNQGNVEGGATGRWIDSGLIHMNQEIGEVLQELGAPADVVKDLNYVKYNGLKPGSLSGGLVQSISPKDGKEYLKTGILPNQYLSDEQQQQISDQRMHPEIHAHQIAELLPDSFYYPASFSTAKGGLSGERLREELESMGLSHNYSDEELDEIASTRAMKLLFQNTHNINSDSGVGSVKMLTRALLNDIDSHHDDETYNLHRNHIERAPTHKGTNFHNRANLVARKIGAHMSNAAGKLIAQGMSQEEAKAEIARRMRESTVNHYKRAYQGPKEGLRRNVEGLIAGMMDITGHERFSLGDIPTDAATQGIATPMPEFPHYAAPDHWGPDGHDRIALGEHEMAPTGDEVRVEPSYPRPETTAPALPPQVPSMIDLPAPPLQVQSSNPADLARRALGGRGYPQGVPDNQLTFGDNGFIINRSFDIASGMDAIKKKIGYFDGFLRGLK